MSTDFPNRAQRNFDKSIDAMVADRERAARVDGIHAAIAAIRALEPTTDEGELRARRAARKAVTALLHPQKPKKARSIRLADNPAKPASNPTFWARGPFV
jgi:hypothetical protein